MNLLKSKEFWTLVVDIVVSSTFFFGSKYLLPEMFENIKFVITNVFQPIAFLLIAVFATERLKTEIAAFLGKGKCCGD